MTSPFLSAQLQRASRLLWGLVVLTLPVTSFRYMPDFMGRTLVQPLAFYPLIALVVVLLVQFWMDRRLPLPTNTRVLFAFLAFALIASMIGLLYAPIPLRGAAIADRLLRGWFSLLIGLAFFLAAFWMNRTQREVQLSLRWLYAGLALTLAWSLVQAVAINTSLIPRSLINAIQTTFSARPLLPRRVSGFAYEPAWLADQIVIFYLPWVVAALLNKRPLLKKPWVEPALIVLCLVVLIFTYSRSGLFTGLMCIAVIFALYGRDLMRSLWDWLVRPFRQLDRARLALPGRLGLLVALVVALLAAVGFLSRYQYFANIWDFGDEENLVDYLVDISAGQRLAYAIAGYQVFEEYPLTGVGLGASGLYLFPHYPDWVRVIPEASRQLSPDSDLIPNIKNLYVRLLAETGLPGFWLFLLFFLSFLAIIRRMHVSGNKFLRYVATAGLFAWLAIGVRNLTQDSFTVPIIWVTLGMLAGLAPLVPAPIRLERSK